MNSEQARTPQLEVRWEELYERWIQGKSSRADREELLRLSPLFGNELLHTREEFHSQFEQLQWQATESHLHMYLPLQHKRKDWYEDDKSHQTGLADDSLGHFGPYKLIRLMREGSFQSKTYLSRHPEGFLCLVKVYDPSVLGMEPGDMFAHQERMIQRLNQLPDPELEEVLEHFVWKDGSYVQIKPFLSCVSLWDWMLTFPVLEARIRLARRVGLTLELLHEQGIAHTDFKPDQILVLVDPDTGVLQEEPEFVLIDFDFSMVDGEWLVAVGSAPYYAPEQFAKTVPKGTEAGIRMDTYAYAIFLHRMLAGRYPFGDGRTKPTNLFQLKQSRKWNSLWVPHKPLRKLLKKALHPKPEKRPELASIVSALSDPSLLLKASEHKGLWTDETSYLGQYWLPLSVMGTLTLSVLFLMIVFNWTTWIPIFGLLYVPAVVVWLQWLSRTG